MRTLWRRLRAAWVTLTGTGAAASVAFGLLVFVSVLASLAIPRQSVELRTGALQRVVAASQPGDRTVTGTVGELALSDGSGQLGASAIAAASAAMRARLAAGGLPLASEPAAWASLTTGTVPVTGAPPAAGYGPPQVEMIYRSALARYSQVVAGRLPAGGSFGGLATGGRTVVQVAVTAATAARFGLRPGSRLDAGPLQLAVTGIVRPRNTASDFWTQSPLAAGPAPTSGGSDQPPYWLGAVFIGPGGLPLVEASLPTSQLNMTWSYPVALSRLTASQASGVEASLSSLLSSGVTIANPGVPPVTVALSSQIPTILSPFIAAESAVDPVLELLYVSLTAMGAVVVLLGARLVAQRRAAEFTLMRARGAALYQLAWVVLRASVLIAAVAGAAAAALAIALTSESSGVPGLPGAPEVSGDVVSWWLAGFTLAVTVVGPVLISVVPQRVAAPVAGRPRNPSARTPGARRIVIEAALIAAAVGALVVLRNQGPSSGSNGLYTSAAPVLIAIPVAVVVLRCYPPLARELARIAGRARGVVAFVGLARATRTPPGTVLPSFALVLVLAMVAFPAMISTSVTQAQVAASWRQVGADAVVQAPPNQVIPPAAQRQISSVPGVVSTATAVVATGSLAAGSVLSAVFVDPAQYAAVVDHAPGPRFPLAALSGAGSAGNGGSGQAAVVPVVATADAAGEFDGTAPAGFTVGTSTITIRLAGRVGTVAGSPGTAGGTIVLPLGALGSQSPGPDVMLIAGPGVDAARLSAVVRRALPGGSVTLRSTVLAALTTAPVPQAAQTALIRGAVTAAGFGTLVLLLSLLLNARTREMTLARLATMGIRRWQAQLMLATEALPPVVAAAIGGVVCAWLLAPLVGPSLNLAVFNGTGPAIVLAPAVGPLAASAVGLLLLALLVLAAQAVITYHRGSARALRIAD
jgi:putative ABC transport system permease protein